MNKALLDLIYLMFSILIDLLDDRISDYEQFSDPSHLKNYQVWRIEKYKDLKDQLYEAKRKVKL